MLKRFEDNKFTGPLSQFLENCRPHRMDAIYNTEYRYIKDIIYDTEKEEKYGKTREGYDRFKEDNCTTNSGEVFLRALTEGGFITESKRTVNDNFNIMVDQFNNAVKRTMEILEVDDERNFAYWLDTVIPFEVSRSGANETISAIQTLEHIIEEYKTDAAFRSYIDKIKGGI